MSLCIRSLQWCTADGRSSNGSCSYYDRARCFSGLTKRNSQLIVSCRPARLTGHRAYSYQLKDMFRKLTNVRLLDYHTTCTLSWSRPERWCSLRGLTREASVCELIIRDRPTHAPLRALLKLLTTVELMLVNMVMVKMSAIPSVDMLTTEDFVLCSSNNIMRTPYSETSVRHLLQPSLSQCSS